MKSSVGVGRLQDLLFQPVRETQVKPLSGSKLDFRMIITVLNGLECFLH